MTKNLSDYESFGPEEVGEDGLTDSERLAMGKEGGVDSDGIVYASDITFKKRSLIRKRAWEKQRLEETLAKDMESRQPKADPIELESLYSEAGLGAEKSGTYNKPPPKPREPKYPDFDPTLVPAVIDTTSEPVAYSEDPVGAYCWARDMWFSKKFSNREIAEAIGIDPKLLSMWVNGKVAKFGKFNWRKVLDESESKDLADFMAKNKAKIKNISGRLMSVLEQAVERLEDSREPLSPKEFSTLAVSLEKVYNMHKIMEAPTEEARKAEEEKKITLQDLLAGVREADILTYPNK